MANRWGDGPDTSSGVWGRVAGQHDRSLDDLLAGVNDETIAMAIRGVQDLQEHWMTVPPGGTLRLSWPLVSPVSSPGGRGSGPGR